VTEIASYHCEMAVVDGRVRRDVLISVTAGRFSAIAEGVRGEASCHLPGLTLPGFANTHSHAFHRALRGRTQAEAGSFWNWREKMFELAERLQPDSYHRLARATFAEMALAGVSAVGEFHYLHHPVLGARYANPNAMGEALLAAAAEVGIRITLLDTVYLHGGLAPDGYLELSAAQRRYSDGDVENWAGRVDDLCAGPNQQVGAAIHSVRAVDPDAMGVIVEWATSRDRVLHAHVSEQTVENDQCRAAHGCSPTELLLSQGALSPSGTLIHGTHLNSRDVAAIANSGVAVCFCPTTERDLGDGIGPSRELVDAGVPLCLGSDSNAVVDMLEESRLLELHERLRSERRSAFSSAALVGAVSEQGQRALGWPDAGSIALGQRADMVSVSLDSVRTSGFTENTALDTVVFSANTADISHVVVDGELIVADGRHRSIDVAEELRSVIRELVTS